jgi:alpha-L-rhamnosidase
MFAFVIISLLTFGVHVFGQPNNLRTEYAVSPITIDNPTPRFSWEVVTQSAYQVVVLSSEGNCMWNSGIVASSSTAGVEYDGSVLVSDEDYTWTVSSRAESGLWLNSSVARFSTALLNQVNDWKGVWIGGSNQIAVNVSLGPAPIVRARAFVTAVGCYELWINGQRISRGGVNMSQPDSFINPGIRYVNRVGNSRGSSSSRRLLQ